MEKMPLKNNEFEEIDEYSEQTRIIGKQYYAKLQPTIKMIEEEHTLKLSEGRTIKIGVSQESSIVDEFWAYYREFSSTNLPDPAIYYGDAAAELKISILLRLFHNYYLDHIYPTTFPVPIIQKSYKSSKSRQIRPAKFLLVGDTHGSIEDSLKLIQYFIREIQEASSGGHDVKIVFIGDFVDRGLHDLHNLLLIMTFNLKFPENVLMLRGNHEEISICAHYGFGKHVMDAFSPMLFANFNYVFKDLPLIATYHCDQGSFMCLHGGIPILIDETTGDHIVPELSKHQFNNRQIWLDNMDPVTQQILWNDPITNYDSHSMRNYYKSRRGVGYLFGEEIFNEFCLKNQVQLVFRGHEVFREGFRENFDRRFITVFSASNYVKKQIHARYVELYSNDIFNFQIRLIEDLP
ncbi:MAG: metallophosphoesterase [Promethearchaeota archaeon]